MRTLGLFSGRFSKKGSPILAWVLIAVTFYLRMRNLGDMEFKSDEAAAVRQIAAITGQAWQPLAAISQNSGVAHSSGFFYFLNWITPGSPGPLPLVWGIAFVNSLFLSLAIWLLRDSRKWLLTFALCATSATLVFGSRKIWAPDLMQAWVILGMSFLGFVIAKMSSGEKASSSRSWSMRLMAAEAAFLFVMSGHMYLPAGLGAAVLTGSVFLWLFLDPCFREKKIAMAWLAGSAAGWLTFAPYFYLMLIHAPGTHGQAGAASFPVSSGALLEGLGKALLALPSTFPFFQLYLWSTWNQLGTIRNDASFQIAVIGLVFGGCLMLLLYAVTLFRTVRHGRALLGDPLILSTLAMWVVFPTALFWSRLGNHLHYWLSVLPLAYYWVAWASELRPESMFSRTLRALAWAAVMAVGIGSFALEEVIHRHRGLPGEYWLAYQNPSNSFSREFGGATKGP